MVVLSIREFNKVFGGGKEGEGLPDFNIPDGMSSDISPPSTANLVSGDTWNSGWAEMDKVLLKRKKKREKVKRLNVNKL